MAPARSVVRLSRLGRPAESDHRWATEALVSLPARSASPAVKLARRGGLALLLLALVVALVWFDRASYTDDSDGVVGLIDAIYYATVTITTTGYGDITPVAPHARILNAIFVTPLRIGFLVLLVGTTLEVLANQGRQIYRDRRWRAGMRNHVVVVGYGTKGRSAVETLEANGASPAQLVVIDDRPTAVADANARGYAAIEATRPAATSSGAPRSPGPARSSSPSTGTTRRSSRCSPCGS